MLVAVVGVFLLVELPLAVLIIMLIVSNTFDVYIIDEGSYEVATLFVNMVIILSYPFNFVIYCAMSRQFRSTFRDMFCPGRASPAAAETDDRTAHPGRINEQTSYVTLADNGRSPERGKHPEERQLLTVETHL